MKLSACPERALDGDGAGCVGSAGPLPCEQQFGVGALALRQPDRGQATASTGCELLLGNDARYFESGPIFRGREIRTAADLFEETAVHSGGEQVRVEEDRPVEGDAGFVEPLLAE